MMIGRTLAVVDAINDRVGRAVSYLVLATMGACVIEVVARYVFNRPTIWAYEFEQLTCAVLYILVGGFVLYHDGHVRIEVLYAKFGHKLQAFIDVVLCYPLLLLMAGGFTYVGVIFAWESIVIWEHSYTSWGPPLWPVKLMLPLGSLLLTFQVAANYLRRIMALTGRCV
jgi:TRAP-type mannitol/chloroaromatic compound transport system permease small subunit